MQDIAGAIKEGFKFFSEWNKSREKRRFKACIEHAERYIFVNEDANLEEKEQNKLLKKHKKKFFKYNQG